MRVLFVEDDELIGEGIASGLRSDGFAVDWFVVGRQADSAISTVEYDCVVLDVGLPGRDGISWLTQWRNEGYKVPVVVLTARDAVDSRVSGLDNGADDYLVKPISIRELSARIRAVTRRASGRATSVWRHGLLEYDAAAKVVRWGDTPVNLTSRELALLEVLMNNPSRVMSKTQICERMYDWGEHIESNSLEVFVHHLRRKLSPQLIRTVRGIGYALGPAQDIEQ